MGLYVIGNFDLLNAESNLWQTITTGLRKQGKIGEALNLYCQNHPNDDGLVIRTPDDFYQAPEGGCMKPCTARLDCGHVCTRMCHPYDKVYVGPARYCLAVFKFEFPKNKTKQQQQNKKLTKQQQQQQQQQQKDDVVIINTRAHTHTHTHTHTPSR